MSRRDLSKAALLALGAGMTRRSFAQKTEKTRGTEPLCVNMRFPPAR